MNNEELYEQLRQEQWRRRPTPGEAAKARALTGDDPERQADWEAETALTELLTGMPDVEISNNFTARTVQAAERKRTSDRRRHEGWRRWWELRWRIVPRVAFTAFMVSAGLVIYREVQSQQREQLVEGLSTVAQVAAVPGPDSLSDFDAIRALSPAPGADVELLRMLQ